MIRKTDWTREALDLRGHRKDRNRDWVTNRAKATDNVGCRLQIIICPVPRSLPSWWALPELRGHGNSACFVTFKRLETHVLCVADLVSSSSHHAAEYLISMCF